MSEFVDDMEYYATPCKRSNSKYLSNRKGSVIVQSAFMERNQSIDEMIDYQPRRSSEIVETAFMERDIIESMADRFSGFPDKNFHFDPTLVGPLYGRSCTDVAFFLILIVFLIGWVGVTVFAFIEGGGLKDLNGLKDSDDRLCDGNNSFLFYFDVTKCVNPLFPIKGCDGVCVKTCPKEFSGKRGDNLVIDDLICKSSVDKTLIQDKGNGDLFEEGQCSQFNFPTKPIGNICVPDILKTKISDIFSILDGYHGAFGFEWKHFLKFISASTIMIETVVTDIAFMVCYPVLVITTCLLFVVAIKFITKPVIVFLILSIIGVLSLLIYISSMYIFNEVNLIAQYYENQTSLVQFSNVPERTFYTYVFTGSVIGLVLIVLVFILLRKRISLAITIIQEGCIAVTSIKSSIIFPVAIWIIQAVTICLSIIVFIHLQSASASIYTLSSFNSSCTCRGTAMNYTNGGQCNPSVFEKECHLANDTSMECEFAVCGYRGMKFPEMITSFQYINVIGLFWSFYFIPIFGDIVLAATFATWYWTFHKIDLTKTSNTLYRGTLKVLRYHLGTITIGWIFISAVAFVENFFNIFQKLYDLMPFKIPIFSAFNTGILIMCAIAGENYIRSTMVVSRMLLKNWLRYLVMDGVATFIFFLTKICIASLLVAVIHMYHPEYKLIGFVFAYYVATLFFKVYTIALNTLILCFLHDCQTNDGSFERPYFMSQKLMKVYGKKNVQPPRRYYNTVTK